MKHQSMKGVGRVANHFHIDLSRGSARIDSEAKRKDISPRPLILETCLYASTC